MSTLTNAAFIPEVWAQQALEIAEQEYVFLDQIRRYAAPGMGELGDTIVIPSVANLTVGTRTEDQAMVFQPTASTSRQLSINNNAYVAFYLTDREVQAASANADLRAVFMGQAMRDLIGSIETSMAGIYTQAGAVFGTAGTALNPDLLLDVGEHLDNQGVAQNERILLLGAKGKKEYVRMVTQEGVPANLVQTHPGAGRAAERAELVDVYGVRPFYTNSVVKTGTAPVANHNVMLHPDSVIFGTLPLITPEGGLGVAGATATNQGLSLRILRSFEHDRTRFKFSIEVAFGWAVLDPQRVVEVRN